MTAAAPPRGAAPHRGDGQRKAVLFKQFAPHLGSIFFPGRHNTSALAGRKEVPPMRVKRGLAAHRRHKKYLSAAKGFRGGRSRLYRTAREAVERSLQYSFIGRKHRKRDFRTLWILRINAGARLNGLSYSRLMHGLNKAGIALNRKVLADLAVYHKDDFAKVVEMAKAAL